MTATQTRTDPPAGGQPRPAGLPLSGRVRPRRLPWAVLGVMVVAGAGLAFAMWAGALGDRVQVLAAAGDLEPGEVLDRGDLRVVELAGGDGAAVVAAADADRLVGLTVLGPVPAGALLAGAMFDDRDPLGPGEVIAGAVLAPGQYPDAGLRPGEVAVLVRPEVTGAAGQARAGRPLGVATVWSVDPLAQAESLLVGFRVDAGVAMAVGAAAADGELRMLSADPAGVDALLADLEAAHAVTFEVAASEAAAATDAGPEQAAGAGVGE